MKKAIISAIFIIISTISFCQSEEDVLSRITEKFQKYTDAFPGEEVFVQTDRDIYIAGEEIWFNIFLFDRKNSSLSDNSKIAYLEVLNTVNRPVAQKRVSLKNGSGAGKVILPDTLRPGIYTLRAYTSWMKNFMPGNCFMKKLKIFNDQKDQVYFVPDNIQNRNNGQGSDKDNVLVILNKKQNIELLILTDNNFRSSNRNTCYLFIQTRGNINYRSAVTLSGDTTRLEIPASDFLPGVNQFTLFNASGKPVIEAYMLTRHEKNKFVEVKIESPDSIGTRQYLSISIQDINNFQNGDSAHVTLAIVPAGTGSRSGISDYLLFGSEFGELPEDFSQYALENIPDSLINKFLFTAKSNWIDWGLILSDHQPEIKYTREGKYHNLDGKILDFKDTDAPENQFVFLSIPGKNATFQYCRCEKDGRFSFSLPVDYKLRDLIIQSNNRDEKTKPVILSSFSDLYPVKDQIGHSESTISPVVRQMGINFRATSIYRSFEPPGRTIHEKFSESTSRFYSKPDIELKMEDYIKLPTMQEVFFEILPGVSLTHVKSGYKVTVMDIFDSRKYENPVLMVDGVIIKDPAKFAGVDPLLVEKIDVIKSRYIVGDYIFSGLINAITTKTDLGNITLSDNVTRLPYQTLEPVEKFNMPEYSIPEKKLNHIPDLRNTLYWNSLHLKLTGTKQSFGFYTSDFLADYVIIIQGVTKKGLFISTEKSIKIIR